ncbi:SpaH/EbpB family LPXTG-anchored major pilin [Bifidobacterium longum subsp. infantis]|uniref:SpaH/EbpB family LPXTG-anchored major pilin n=1 Tax=Bifidobacterium longum TaxID=216816 RepID=UPI00187AA64E|nr:SpaH/EbpB family LPXTG-anchored major pilin [Bifidobacterium longum]QOL44802.1 SpaH/EbpB family LPXTG-anchored major pilin [Bifidobacterium longum subsp. infantis]
MRLKNITAMVAAIATAASLGTVAVASADAQTVTTGDATITLNAQTAGQLTGHTFKAVKIASYDVYGTEPNQSVTLRTEDDVKAEVVKYLTATSHYAETDGDPLAWAQQQNDPKLDQSGASPWLGDGTTRGLADALAPQAKSAFTPVINGATATFTLTSPGLWLIVDQAATDASSRSLPILAGTPLTINGKQVSTGRIAMKNQTASVSKTVADQTVAAGQDASYTITTAIPNYVGYKVQGYQFTVSDTFDANAPLSYKPGTLTVKVGDQVLTAGTDYTVTGFDATSKTFTIDLSKYITANGFFGTSAPKPESTFTDADLVGKTVTVEYKATVTGSTGNAGAANKPAIKYPNDPTNNENKQEVPGTPVKVFNFDYTLLKKDKTTGAALEGAKFAIKQNKADGKYLAYTTGQDGKGAWSELAAKPESTATGTAAGVFATGQDGKVRFPALDEGKYTIEEIAAPNGYTNVGVSFNFEIKANLTGTGAVQTANPTYAIDADSATGSDRWGLVSNGNGAEATVENVKSITQLPLTGGAGTMLFTVFAVLLIGAGVAVSVKSRKTSAIA